LEPETGELLLPLAQRVVDRLHVASPTQNRIDEPLLFGVSSVDGANERGTARVRLRGRR